MSDPKTNLEKAFDILDRLTNSSRTDFEDTIEIENIEIVSLENVLGTWGITGTVMQFKISQTKKKSPTIIAWNKNNKENYIISDINFEYGGKHTENLTEIQFQTVWTANNWKTFWTLKPIIKNRTLNLMNCKLITQSGLERNCSAYRVVDENMMENNPDYTCPKCGKTSTNKGAMTIHKRSCNGNIKVSKEVKNAIHKCPKCGKISKNKGAMTVHIRACKFGEAPSRPTSENSYYEGSIKQDLPSRKTKRSNKIIMKDDALQMMREGKKRSEIADILGIDATTLKKWQMSAGISGIAYSDRKGQDSWVIHRRPDGIRLLSYGNSVASVAKRLGVSKSCVYRWRKEAGLSAKKEKALSMIRAERSGIIHTDLDIAEKLNLRRSAIKKWRKEDKSFIGKEHLKEEALLLIQDGVSTAETARRLDVAKGTVRKWRKEAGLPIQNPNSGKSHLKEEALLLVKDGLSGAETARILGIGSNTVNRWKKEAGLSVKTEKYNVEQENDVIDLIRNGISYAEISRITGVSVYQIKKWKNTAKEEGFL